MYIGELFDIWGSTRSRINAFIQYQGTGNVRAMFADCQTDGLANSQWLTDRVVNIPSSAVE